MAQVLSCSRGHRWEAPGDLPVEALPESTVCPVCGETQVDGSEWAEETNQVGGGDELPPLPGSIFRTARVDQEKSNLSPRDSPFPPVPGYAIVKELGRGGMGVVYLARQVALDRLVALKMIRSGVHADPEELARFRVEAEAVARLQHPHIVQIYEVGTANGEPFFSLEFIDGTSLADQLDGTPWPASPSARLVEILARAIHFAHERGVIHRDLKPANVLLSAEGGVPGAEKESAGIALHTPKIVDFGLAKKLEASPELTSTGAIMGTPSYMAPEQASPLPSTSDRGVGRLRRGVSPATDVYALGVILYELLTGRPPFKAATVFDTVQQVLFEDPVPPRRLQPKTPRDLETICLKCLHKEPGKRYASAQELAQDLRRFQAGEPIWARPVSAWERGRKWVRRHPAAAGLISVSVLSLLALVVTILIYTRQVEQGREDALRAEAEARRREKQTKDNLQKTFVAVDKFLTRVGEMRVLHAPYMEGERAKVFEDALSFCQEFLEENGDELLAREEVGLTLIRKGYLLRLLNRFPQAEESYQAAIAFLEKWETKEPDNVFYPYHRARAFHELGNQVYWAQGLLDQAREAGHQAKAILKPLLEKNPTRDNRLLLGRCCHFLGLLDQAAGRKKQAEDFYLSAQDLWEKLRNDFPLDPSFRLKSSQTLNQLGQLYESLGRTRDAEKALNESHDLVNQLHQEFPSEADFLSDLGAACINLGNFFTRTHRAPEGEKLYQKAADHLRKLLDRQPSRPDFQNQLAMAYHNLGDSASDKKDYVVAENFLNQALELNRNILQRHRRYLPFARDLALNYQSLSDVYRSTNREDMAIGALREALNLLDEIVAEDGKTIQYRWDRGRSAFHLAYLTWPRAQNAGTLELFDKAVDSLEMVLIKEPDHEKARLDLVKALHFRGVARSVLALHKESMADWTRLAALTGSPQREQYQVFRLRCLVRLGDYATGLAESAKLDESKVPANLLYDLACFYARVAESFLEKKDADSKDQGEKMALKSVALLERAYKEGPLRSPAKMEMVQRERDLRVLRTRTDFQALLKKWISP